jgi:hypothetical protein
MLEDERWAFSLDLVMNPNIPIESVWHHTLLRETSGKTEGVRIALAQSSFRDGVP